MRFYLICVLVLIPALCLSQTYAQNTSIWGATTSTSIGQGISPSGGAIGPPWTWGPSDGGENILTSESVAEDNRGYAKAFVALDSTGLTPTMTSYAFLKDQGNNVARGGGFAVTGYTYNGVGTASFTLNLSLSGDVQDPLNNSTRASARVYIFEPENFVFTNSLGTLLYEYGAIAKTGAELVLDGGQSNTSSVLNFTLEQGETFYLWETLNSHAAYADSRVDVFLEAVFQNTDGLTRNIPTEPSETWSFVQISDTHIGAAVGDPNARTHLGVLLNKVLKEVKPAFIVNTGDIVDWGCGTCLSGDYCTTGFYESYSQAIKLATDKSVPVYNISGNHDQRLSPIVWRPCDNWPSCFKDPYGNPDNWFMFSRSTFLSDDGTILFIVLDTGNSNCSGSLDQEDIDFLNGLNKDVKKIILTHHPAWSDDDEVKLTQELLGFVLCPDPDFQHTHIVDKQWEFLQYCSDQTNKVCAVLSGHTHLNHSYAWFVDQYIECLGWWENGEWHPWYPLYVQTGSAGKVKMSEGQYPVFRKVELIDGEVRIHEETSLAKEDYNYISDKIYSPANIHVYDSHGHHTGSDQTGGFEREIPNSVYFSHYVIENEGFNSVFPEEVLVIDPSDQYLHQVIGMEEGTYKLKISFVSAGEEICFEAIGIPTSPGAKHIYSVDWEAISAGEEGIIIEIDADGDGVFERSITADEDLTAAEFALQTETMIDFEPDTLNLGSKGKFVTVYIELSQGYDVSNIDVSSLKLNDMIPALSKPVSVGDYDGDGIADLMVKFDRQEVVDILEPGTQMIVLSGQLYDETQIAGVDFVRVIDNRETGPEFETVITEDLADSKKNQKMKDENSVNIGEEDTFNVKEVLGFMLFEADEIIDGLGPESFDNVESAFQLSCAIDEVFVMLDEGMYVESLILLENDILQRTDGCVNIGKPDEDDCIINIEGQALLYPRIVETIKLLESLL